MDARSRLDIVTNHDYCKYAQHTKLITNHRFNTCIYKLCMELKMHEHIWKVHERHHTETTDLLYWLCNSLDTYWLLCTTADGQLTSRPRLEPLYIVSQGTVSPPSGHISSSQSTYVLDICMVGWTGAHELTVHVVYCVLALTQTLTQHTNKSNQWHNILDTLALK